MDNNQILIEQEFLNLLTVNGSTTTLDVKEALISKYPHITWKQKDVSLVCMDTSNHLGISYTTDSNQGYRTYHKPSDGGYEPKNDFDYDNKLFTDLLDEVSSKGLTFTKRQLKSRFKGSADNFNTLFEDQVERRIKFTGKYNNENHKIYAFVVDKQHYSVSRRKAVAIGNMHPEYAKNALRKYYGSMTINELFSGDTNSEAFLLVKGYFNNLLVKKLTDLVESDIKV